MLYFIYFYDEINYINKNAAYLNQIELNIERISHSRRRIAARRPTHSRQMANSRGKHTRHNSYQLTNRRGSVQTWHRLFLTY